MKLAILLLTLLVSFAQASTPENFAKVNNDIFRGARPSDTDLESLAQMGVKTVITIDSDKKQNAHEKVVVTKLGMQSIAVPLSGFFAPSDKDVEKILSALNDKTNYPIYLHCLHGQDRTGLLVGLYRVFYEKVSPAQAYDEMLKLGFHKALLGLNHYFEEKTGFED